MVLSGVGSTSKTAFSILNRTQLLTIKNKAIRAGIWYKALTRIDRVLVDLTIKVTDCIRSSHLTKSLLVVLEKLKGKLDSSYIASMRKLGYTLATKMSIIAQKWGNASAKDWSADSAFALFLAITHGK